MLASTHLDTCFAPLGGGRALVYPPAFTAASQAVLAENFATLIAVSEHDATRFACNAVLADETVVLNSGCTETVHASSGTTGSRWWRRPWTSSSRRAGARSAGTDAGRVH